MKEFRGLSGFVVGTDHSLQDAMEAGEVRPSCGVVEGLLDCVVSRNDGRVVGAHAFEHFLDRI